MSLLDEAQPAKIDAGRKSFLFYGPGGSGKTTFGLHHPAKRKLWIDIDDKMHEMENVKPELFNGVKVWRINETLGSESIQIATVDRERKDPTKGTKISQEPRGYKKTAELINELLAIAYKIKRGDLPPDAFPFDLICIDTLGRLGNHLEYLVMHAHGVTNMTETLYGVFKRNITEFITNFMSLPCVRMVITHERDMSKRDKTTGALISQRILPLITGGFSNEINSYFSEAYYFLGCDTSDQKWKIQTATDRTLPARTTRNLAFEQVLDPKVIYG